MIFFSVSEGQESWQVAIDANSLASVIRACKNAGEWQQAVALQLQVELRRLHDTLTHSALMGAYALNAMWEEAVFLLEDLSMKKAAGVKRVASFHVFSRRMVSMFVYIL